MTTRVHQSRRLRTLLGLWFWPYVLTHLSQECLPEQITGRLRRAYSDDRRKCFSAETIHAALYMLPRGALRRELLAVLRQARKAHRPRSRGVESAWPIPIHHVNDRPPRGGAGGRSRATETATSSRVSIMARPSTPYFRLLQKTLRFPQYQ